MLLKSEPWGNDGLRVREFSEAVLDEWISAPRLDVDENKRITNRARIYLVVRGCLVDADGKPVFDTDDAVKRGMTRAQTESCCEAALKLSGMWSENAPETPQDGTQGGTDPNAGS